jgi:cytochrome P450
MTMISFTQPFGFVRNSRDERLILTQWRKGLDYFGFVGRFRFFREHVMKWPYFGVWSLPSTSDDHGMGYLMNEADRQVTQREKQVEEGTYEATQPDFMQWCLEARRFGQPLTAVEKRAHVTLLIQAGADTTGTALGSTLRYIVTRPHVTRKVREELEAAEENGDLSTPILYEETRTKLPYFVACIKESLRLDPPATNLFARTVNKSQIIDGHLVPPGTDITSNAYVVQRDPELYAPDPLAYRPERWLESEEKAAIMEAASFTVSNL